MCKYIERTASMEELERYAGDCYMKIVHFITLNYAMVKLSHATVDPVVY